MKMLVFDSHSYDRTFLDAANQGRHELVYTQAQLDVTTAAMAQGYKSVCLFVNDRADAQAMERGAIAGVGLDVYEEEEGNFFRDLSDHPMDDDVLARLISFPNVLVAAGPVSGHRRCHGARGKHQRAESSLSKIA